MPTQELHGLLPKARVVPSSKRGQVEVSDGLLGRVIDSDGHPLDGRGPIRAEGAVTLAGVPLNPLMREPITSPLDVGVRAINALNALTADPTDTLRFTVARVEVSPNSSNSVANLVRFTIDLRHPDEAVLREKGDAIEPTIRAAVAGCGVDVFENFHAMPVAFHPTVVEAVAQGAEAQGLRARRLPSGAFHDAQFVVPVCPTGMIFVPSRNGISHNPAEYSSPALLEAGARLLVRTLESLAR
jgi:acetylornithine deacetylase/succinyl-diaminopimelate desuccinylase-like protein